MKKLLIPIVALLAFSMLSTSVSANNGDYYMASFYGEANGLCWVQPEFTWPPEAVGKGNAQVRGLAIVTENTDCYLAARAYARNTRLWTRRTRLTVSWNSKKLMVYMWPSYDTWLNLNDTENWFDINMMRFFGYYKGEAGLQFVSGTADIYCGLDSPIIILEVLLYVETGPWLMFLWSSAEQGGWPAAQHVSRRVTVWGPIPWHPIPP